VDYLLTLPGVAYRLAAWLRRDLAMAESDAMPWLRLLDTGCSPPLGEDVLAEIARDALHYGTHAIGSGLVMPPPAIPRRIAVRLPRPRRYRVVTTTGPMTE